MRLSCRRRKVGIAIRRAPEWSVQPSSPDTSTRSRVGPSVFFRIGELRSRDAVEIRRADGTVAVFAVDDVRRFRKTDFPLQLVYDNTDDAVLRLITCGGPFDLATGHYLDNIVVTASLVRAG